VKPLDEALIGFFPQLLPEAVLVVAACAFFLGGTWRARRRLWGIAALVALALAGVALAYTAAGVRSVEALKQEISEPPRKDPNISPAGQQVLDERRKHDEAALPAMVYASPVLHSRLSVLFAWIAIAGGAVLVLLSWNDVPDEYAAEYHACLLLVTAGVCLTGMANDLITLFLALELVSIPTYILLYLPRSDPRAQESAMKYFLLSIFSSALLLFGFSYLYGAAGTTNIPAIVDALSGPAGAEPGAAGLALVALVLVTAGLGFKLAAAPFHFYAPDVYQGTTTSAAALLAFAPKVAAVAALIRLLGYAPGFAGGRVLGLDLGGQTPRLLWILAAVTMSLGNVLALLQDNLKRLFAYSSVAHAGYMLVGLAVAPKLGDAAAAGGVDAVLFYLVAYGAMTVGAFAVIGWLSTPARPVETVDDLAGLSGSRPAAALVMALFLFSLIGMPLTAGFWGKLQLFFGTMSTGPDPAHAALLKPEDLARQTADAWFFRALGLILAVNAAVGAWYYLRIAAVMYLRTPLQLLERTRPWPAMAAVWACALVTLGVGLFPWPLSQAVKKATHGPPAAAAPGPPRAAAATGGPAP
jgi:NADH-quinone oxidoreductase subunit N